jgi:hypothetical protein
VYPQCLYVELSYIHSTQTPSCNHHVSQKQVDNLRSMGHIQQMADDPLVSIPPPLTYTVKDLMARNMSPAVRKRFEKLRKITAEHAQRREEPPTDP